MSGAWSPIAGRPSCSRTRRPASTSRRSSPSAGSRSRRSRATRTRSIPIAAIAAGADEAYRDTVRLAAEIGVDTVITFSGCPGESEHSLRPSWVTCSWPDDFPETLAWQWDERVLPYWADAAAFAERTGFASRSSRTLASSSTTPPR